MVLLEGYTDIVIIRPIMGSWEAFTGEVINYKCEYKIKTSLVDYREITDWNGNWYWLELPNFKYCADLL
jgi:hypothetical protein